MKNIKTCRVHSLGLVVSLFYNQSRDPVPLRALASNEAE
jgi:hypothetical protein